MLWYIPSISSDLFLSLVQAVISSLPRQIPKCMLSFDKVDYLKKILVSYGWAWWHTVIPALQEAEVGGSQVHPYLGDLATKQNPVLK